MTSPDRAKNKSPISKLPSLAVDAAEYPSTQEVGSVMSKLVSLVFLCLPVIQAQPTPSSIIRGTVVDDKGKPMSNVIVTALLNARPPFTRSTTSAADGSFQIQGLLAGQYSLCAQLPAGGYLDACRWSLTSRNITLANRQTSAGNTVTLRKASVLKIRLQDPNRQRAQK